MYWSSLHREMERCDYMKRLLCLSIAAALVLGASMGVAAAPSITSHVAVSGYDNNVDYMAEMMNCLNDGSDYAFEVGRIYEQQRNMKIEDLGMDYDKTSYFQDYIHAADVLAAMKAEQEPEPTPTPVPTPEPVPEPAPEPPSQSYSEDDLFWLSRVVYAEAGCDWFPDWVQQAVASVVLNRVADSRYPNTIKDVIFDPWQYSCVNSGSIYNQPTSKVIENCRYVLEHGSTLPVSVIGQSGYALGPVYTSYYDSVLGTTIYFFSC